MLRAIKNRLVNSLSPQQPAKVILDTNIVLDTFVFNDPAAKPLLSALQTGVIDGAENNPPSFFTSNHYTTGTKFYAQTNHLIIPELLVMSKVTWDKLTPADQTLVKKVAREAQMEQRVLWDKSVAEYTEKLKTSGVEFVQVDQKLFYDATAPVRAKYGAKFADLMKRIDATK